MNDEQKIHRMITYTPEMADQIEQLKGKLAAMPFPVPTNNVSEIVTSAVLRLYRDVAGGKEISVKQIRAWNAMYPDGRGAGQEKKEKKPIRTVYFTPEVDDSVQKIGQYLEKRFSKATVPMLLTSKGKMNGRLICAYAIYYALEVD